MVSTPWDLWPFPAEDPYEPYQEALTRTPIIMQPGLGHIVLSYSAANEVLRTPIWSSDPRKSQRLKEILGGAGDLGDLWSRSLLMSDPPLHTQLRSVVHQYFAGRSIRAIEQRIQAIVSAAFADLDRCLEAECVDEIAYPVPLAVMAEIFDIGLEGAELLREETPKLARLLEVDADPDAITDALASGLRLLMFLAPIVASRARSPQSDLISAILHSTSSDDFRLDPDEVAMMVLLLITAGHETAAHLIGYSLYVLAGDPALVRFLRRRPELVSGAVDEILRFESPLQITSRVATEDCRVAGMEIQAGSEALVVLGAANRDPSQYPRSDALDVTRRGPPHLAFGAGPHYCIGAALARMEASEAIRHVTQSRRVFAVVAAETAHTRTFRRITSLHVRASTELDGVA